MTSVQIYLYLFIFPVKAICNVDTYLKKYPCIPFLEANFCCKFFAQLKSLCISCTLYNNTQC